jgi:WD40 repeat protein
VRIWDLAAFKEIAHLPIGRSHSAFFHPDGKSLFTTGSEGLHQWPITATLDGRSLRIGPPDQLATSRADLLLIRAAVGTDDGSVALVTDDNEVELLQPGKQVDRVRFVSPGPVNRVALSANGNWLATARDWPDNAVEIWNARTGKLAQRLPHVGGYVGACFSPDTEWLVTNSTAYYRIWEVGSWRLKHTFKPDHGVLRPVAFTRDASTMAVAHSQHVVKLYATTTFQELATLEAPQQRGITWLCFSPDETLLAVAGGDRVIHIWDLGAIREHLETMGLDWEPPLPPRPRTPARTDQPLLIEVERIGI